MRSKLSQEAKAEYISYFEEPVDIKWYTLQMEKDWELELNNPEDGFEYTLYINDEEVDEITKEFAEELLKLC